MLTSEAKSANETLEWLWDGFGVGPPGGLAQAVEAHFAPPPAPHL